MHDMPFLADLAASRTEPSFQCSRTEGAANAERLFALTESVDQVEVSDLAPVESPFRPLQRALVSSSLLKTGDRPNGHKPSR